MSKEIDRTWNRKATVSFTFCALAGFVIWFASVQLTGHREPWDDDSGFYFWYLLGAGALAVIFVPRHFWACPLGIYVGQAVAMLTLLQFGSMAPLGLLVALPIMSVISLVGWCVGAAIHLLIAKAHSRFSQASE